MHEQKINARKKTLLHRPQTPVFWCSDSSERFKKIARRGWPSLTTLPQSTVDRRWVGQTSGGGRPREPYEIADRNAFGRLMICGGVLLKHYMIPIASRHHIGQQVEDLIFVQ